MHNCIKTYNKKQSFSYFLSKIINSICCCLFFCLANIYRPSLEKVWLARPNPKLIQPPNFYHTRKKNIL